VNISSYAYKRVEETDDSCAASIKKKQTLRLIDLSEDFYQESVDKFIFRVKRRLLYSENDVWVRIQDDGSLLGVTDFLQRRGGDVVFAELPQKGRAVIKGDEISSLETIKAVVTVTSPINGVIAEINSALNDKPELINEDPYGDGWLALVSPTNFEEDKLHLMSAERYFELMKTRIKTEAEKSGKKEV
jgi:glycine cleavage system H protein